MQILSPEEYELLCGLPRLTGAEQDLYFYLTPREQLVFNRVRTPRTRVHFLLMLDFFKARQLFFVVDDEVMSDDLAFLADRLDCRVCDVLVSKHTRQMHVSWVLDLLVNANLMTGLAWIWEREHWKRHEYPAVLCVCSARFCRLFAPTTYRTAWLHLSARRCTSGAGIREGPIVNRRLGIDSFVNSACSKI